MTTLQISLLSPWAAGSAALSASHTLLITGRRCLYKQHLHQQQTFSRAAWQGKNQPPVHFMIILQSFSSLRGVRRQQCPPVQLPLRPHLQWLGKETHSQESFTISPSLPTMQVQQPELFPLHGCHPASPSLPPSSAHPTQQDSCGSFTSTETAETPARATSEPGLLHIPARGEWRDAVFADDCKLNFISSRTDFVA